MAFESLSYDNLIAGDVNIVTEQMTIGKSQVILRGDVLVKNTITKTYVRPQAAVIVTDSVLIASEDITTDAINTGVSIGYREGVFNECSMRFGGTSTADDNRDVLENKSIYIKKNQYQ